MGKEFSKTISLRPRNEVVDFWIKLREDCIEKNISVSNLFNAIIPALAAELIKQTKTPTNCYQLNLGVIRIE